MRTDNHQVASQQHTNEKVVLLCDYLNKKTQQHQQEQLEQQLLDIHNQQKIPGLN